MVAMAIMALVFAGACTILDQGLSYFRSDQRALKAQRSCLNLMSRLSSELEETNINYIYISNGSPYGIAFADPFNPKTHALSVDPATGVMKWQRYICYYLDPDGSGRVLRKEVPIIPSTSSPYAPADAGRTPAWFAAQTNLDTTTVCDDVTKLVLSKPAVASGRYDIYATVYAGDPNAVKVQGGQLVPNSKDEESYWLKVSTQISPRN